MDFWSKIKDTGNSVAEKAKDMGELAKLNSKLSSEETRKSKAIAEIGRIYYELNKGELGKEFLPFSAEANDADEQIALIKKQINDVKGIRLCCSCGAEIGKDDLFCGTCGARNEKEVPVEEEKEEETPQNICPVCKAVIPEGKRFCPTCGEPVAAAQPAAEEEKPEVEDIAVSEEE